MLEVFGQARERFKPETPAPAAVAASPDAAVWEQFAVQIPSAVGPILNGISGIIMAAKSKPGTASVAGMPTATPAPTAAPFNPYDQAAMKEYIQQQKAALRPQAAPTAAPSSATLSAPPSTAPEPGPAEQQPGDVILTQVAMLVAQAINCTSTSRWLRKSRLQGLRT